MAKSNKTKICPICGEPKKARGFKTHVEACRAKQGEAPNPNPPEAKGGFCKCKLSPGFKVVGGRLICVKCGGLSTKAKMTGAGAQRHFVKT
jgi:hypothetical protein